MAGDPLPPGERVRRFRRRVGIVALGVLVGLVVWVLLGRCGCSYGVAGPGY